MPRGCGVRRVIAAATAMLPSVYAQPVTPGAVQDTLKPPPALQSPAPVPPLMSDLAASAPPPVVSDARTVVVNSFTFTGNTLLPTETLAAAVADYTNRPITLAELYEAADRVTVLYVRQGYTLASVIVPAQQVADGSVQLEVIEGRVARLRYEGFSRYEPEDLAPLLGRPEGQVFRAADFEQRLRAVDALPGLDVRARLQPGADYGTTDILLVGREKPFSATVFGDNSGTPNIGVFRYGAVLTANNPLGVADQLIVTGLRSSGGLLNHGSVSYSLPTGLAASRLALSFGQANFEVGGAFAGVSGSNRTLRAELSAPLANTASAQTGVSLAGHRIEADTDFSGITFNRSEVTLAELGVNHVQSHANRALSQAALVVASNFQNVDEGDPAPTAVPLRAELDAQHLLPIGLGWQLQGRVQAVYSPDVLPDVQKFSLGGPTSVRAYAPTEARGDYGYLTQLSLRRSLAFGAVLLTPRAFYDYGEVRQHDIQGLPAASALAKAKLGGYGLGADASYRSFSARADYAWPTTGAPVSDGKEDGRFYGSVSLSF